MSMVLKKKKERKEEKKKEEKEGGKKRKRKRKKYAFKDWFKYFDNLCCCSDSFCGFKFISLRGKD